MKRALNSLILEAKASNLQALDVRPAKARPQELISASAQASSSMTALTNFEELFFLGDPEELTQEMDISYIKQD